MMDYFWQCFNVDGGSKSKMFFRLRKPGVYYITRGPLLGVSREVAVKIF